MTQFCSKSRILSGRENKPHNFAINISPRLLFIQSQQAWRRASMSGSLHWTLTYLRTPVYYQESFVPWTSVTSEKKDYWRKKAKVSFTIHWGKTYMDFKYKLIYLHTSNSELQIHVLATTAHYTCRAKPGLAPDNQTISQHGQLFLFSLCHLFSCSPVCGIRASASFRHMMWKVKSKAKRRSRTGYHPHIAHRAVDNGAYCLQWFTMRVSEFLSWKPQCTFLSTRSWGRHCL